MTQLLSPRMTDVIVRNDKAFTDSESTFVASVCECGVAVRDDEYFFALKTKNPGSSAREMLRGYLKFIHGRTTPLDVRRET